MKRLSIYIHIPFCIKKCIYCDFLSFPVGTLCTDGAGTYRKAYIDAVCSEIKSYGSIADKYIISTVFIGGGTPSILISDDIAKIMATVRSTFRIEPDAEITIETNPGTLTRSKADEYIRSGINRISIGLQSANDEELIKLGRVHNYDQFLAAFNTARQAGFKNINIDIMAALPGQNVHSYLDTIEKVLRCRPEHISAYSLIVEDGTPLAENEKLLSELPDEDTERNMYEATEKVLSLSGYKRYEISNYAKNGYECKHNMVYWTLGEYIGIGIGAASLFEGKRYSNTENIKEYIDACMNQTNYNKLFNIRVIDEKLNSERLMEEYMFLGLRMIKGVSAERFNDYFGHSIYDIYGPVINKYVESGHIINDGGIISLTKTGIDVSNTILADFLIS